MNHGDTQFSQGNATDRIRNFVFRYIPPLDRTTYQDALEIRG